MDILNSLLSGNAGNNGMLGALLPLLLKGGRGNMDLSSMLSLFGGTRGKDQGTTKGQEHPPLYGYKTAENNQAGSILPLLQTLMGKGGIPQPSVSSEPIKAETEYPYELQYNHPDGAKR